MAGFFDGEGYVGILKRKREKWNIEYYIQLSIGQNDGEIMDWIVDNFGGRVYKIKRDGSYFWSISNKEAYNILKKITPFLKYKKPQAELAIEFHENRSHTIPIPKEELERREIIYTKMKSLKKVFTKSTHNNNVRRFND